MKNKMTARKLLLTFALSLSCLAARSQTFAVATNVMDYADFCTLNLEASYGFDRHWTVNAGFRYNPFSFRSANGAMQRRQCSFSAGTRFWPWHIYSGWWLSAELRYQEYNHGGIRSPATAEGDRFGAGAGCGYAYMIAPRLNLDFGLGLWAGYDRYTEYDCQTCGKITDRGDRFFVLPASVIVALTYIF